MKIAENFYQYGIDVKIVDCSGYEDVGEMSRIEFQKRKNKAKPWKPADKLVHMISKIRSGSAV